MWCLCLDLGAVPKSSFPFSLPKKRGKGKRGSWAGSREGSCYLPIRGPGQRSALGGLSFAAGADHLLLQLVHDDFPFQILCRARKKSVREPGGTVARPRWPSPTPPTPKCSETASGFPQGCSQMALKFHHSTLVASLSRGRGQGHQFRVCDPSWWSHWPSRAPPLRSERQGENLDHKGGSKPSKTPSLREVRFFWGESHTDQDVGG